MQTYINAITYIIFKFIAFYLIPDKHENPENFNLGALQFPVLFLRRPKKFNTKDVFSVSCVLISPLVWLNPGRINAQESSTALAFQGGKRRRERQIQTVKEKQRQPGCSTVLSGSVLTGYAPLQRMPSGIQETKLERRIKWVKEKNCLETYFAY